MSPGGILHSVIDWAVSTSGLEWTAIVTALLYVILAAKENSLCWPFGIISSAIYVYYNFHLKLYNDAWLSIYYCGIGIYGWYAWLRGKSGERDGAVLHRMKMKGILICILTGAATTVILGEISRRFTDSPVPYFDGALTAFSLVATWMTARKILENWIFWIVIDAAYVVIYQMRNSPATAILFLIYTIIAVYGFLKWKKRLTTSAA